MTRKGEQQKSARYAMVIDLDRCTGCGVCLVACAAENNVPPPSPKATDRTGLNWIRVFTIETEKSAVFLPVLCMQCEDETPCASVCPQKAVEFDPATGVVGQIAERCLGCRYCMAACPYQARVFNWADPLWPPELSKALNPSVSVRQRGTVEKCNFCHGRWHAARQKAAAEGRRQITAAEYQPACAEACPSEAILFGDLRDPAFAETAKQGFRLLESLHTGPKVFYRTARPEVRAAVEGARHA
jgi:molybdopterin-containing oxidoreductase family iron-sulfur binding subunit